MAGRSTFCLVPGARMTREGSGDSECKCPIKGTVKRMDSGWFSVHMISALAYKLFTVA
jgi:hypothetical protein